jgi:hypothetical protein
MRKSEMSDNEVDFSLLLGREIPTRYSRRAKRSSGKANKATSSLSSCGDRSRSRAAIAVAAGPGLEMAAAMAVETATGMWVEMAAATGVGTVGGSGGGHWRSVSRGHDFAAQDSILTRPFA